MGGVSIGFSIYNTSLCTKCMKFASLLIDCGGSLVSIVLVQSSCLLSIHTRGVTYGALDGKDRVKHRK